MKWKYEHWTLAKRLGMPGVARRIHDTTGPWIIPTAAAYFALQHAGMWPVEDSEPEPIVSVGVYR